ncbi:sugar 3,4-ketoisomerase [Hymenobacter perfusus]|nr:FdtA/QdtA family cupin domain-containing protein [Hymenobacter perfusus]RSK40825.1 WxcM-like domain-containing protein [Hymenobacter perfusus]
MTPTPQLFPLKKLGDDSIGFLSIAENKALPFPVKRVYWTYLTPTTIIRGHHAHYELDQLIFAVNGSIRFELEWPGGHRATVELTDPSQGLLVPRLCWHTMTFTEGAVLLSLASEEYQEADYIRDYEVFRALPPITQ